MGSVASAPSSGTFASSASNAPDAMFTKSLQKLSISGSNQPPPPSVVAVTFEHRHCRAVVTLPASAARGDAPLLGTTFFRAYFHNIPADEVWYRYGIVSNVRPSALSVSDLTGWPFS